MEKDGIPAAATKKEPNYRGWKAMPYVIGNETFEKLGTYGTSSNLLVYFTTVFNMKSITAANALNIFNGTCNFGTLLGAFVSDSYIGRYKTIAIASVASFLGMLMLTMTAAFPSLRPPKCSSGESSTCTGASSGQLAFLFSAFVLLVIGASGIRPCNLAFGADQFDPNTESGKRGADSFFNWYYFTATFGIMVSLTAIVYVQSDVSWAIGLGIPALLMFLSCAFFFVGTRIYVMVLPQGSPLTNLVRTLVVAFKKRKLQLPEQPCGSLFDYHSPESINSKLAYSDQFRWLNKAAVITGEDKINEDGTAADPWSLCSVQQIEEIKCVIRVIPIWVSGIIYYIILVQTQTNVVFQALQTDRRLGHGSFKIPAATYGIFALISLTLWIPFHDRVLVPLLRRVTRREEGMTMLQRIGFGLFLSVLIMLVSGAVEGHRRTLALTRPTLGRAPHKGAVSSMSGNLLIPQLVLTGISEAFAAIGQVEFYYKEFPENMRSFAGSFLFCGFAISSYFTSLLVSIVHKTSRVGETSDWLDDDLNKGRLDYFYYMIAGLEALNLAYFLVCSKWYRYKNVDSDNKEMNVGMEKIDPHKLCA